MKELKKLVYIFDREQKREILGLMFMVFVGTLVETLGVTAIVPFIEAIMYPEKVMTNEVSLLICKWFNVESAETFVVFLAIALVFLYVFKNAYLICMYGMQFRFVYNNQRKLSNDLMTSYLERPYTFHLQHNSAELQNNIYTEVETFFNTVLYMINVVTDCMVCVALVLVLFMTDKSITIGVAALLGGFLLVFYGKFRKGMYRLGQERKIGSQESIKAIHHAFGGIKEIKVLGREEYFQKSYDKSYRNFVEAKRKVNAFSMTPKPLMETICVTGLLLVVSVKLISGVNMEYFIPTLSVFALAVIRLLPSGSRLAANINQIQFGLVSVDAIYRDLLEIREWKESTKGNFVEKKEQFEFKKEIKIEDLTFGYEGTETTVLNEVSLVIPKNKSVAFVGASGAGKTTLADIILGILPYQSGTIRMDDKIIDIYSAAWKNNIGYIPQSIYVVDDTIRRNIALGVDDDDIDDSRIWNALRDAQLKEFVESLNEGLDTMLGEQGVRISGGQRQRIGIARALYHDPKILVLDEATSALDNETERAVMEAIDTLSGHKTLIIIAHRLSTIENCDYIYRVEEGKVILEKSKV